MTLHTTLSTLSITLVLALSSLAGCAAADAEQGPAPATSSSEVTLAGNVNGVSSGSIATKKFGSVASAGGDLHVIAHEVHVRGEKGRSVDVAVAADGSFHLDVARGKRWLVTVDDSTGSSAIITFGNGQNILSVSANGGTSRVDVGGLSLVGGEARSSIAFEGLVGIDATLAGLDDVFEAANGAVIAARAAAEEARKAADEARAAADAARDTADEARRAAEEARKAAGQ